MSTRIFPATDESMQTVFDFVHSQIPQDCSVEVLNKIDLAVEEIFINIAHSASTPDTGNAEIECKFENDTLTVVFSDSGKEFNPLARTDPDTSLSLDERDIGGLGIFLTKQFMDSVKYEYVNNKNTLSIQKKIV